MSVFKELKNKKNFDDYVAEAYKELGVSQSETKQVYYIVRNLVCKLLNSDDFMDGDVVDRFDLAQYMSGAIVVALASKDNIMEEASIKGKKFNIDVVEDTIKDFKIK